MNSTFNPLSIDVPARPLPAVSFGWLSRAGQALWKACEASSQARARQHMLDFAVHCEHLQPELAKEIRAASRQISN